MDEVPSACFGYWEGLNEPEAHREVLKFIETWARERGQRSFTDPLTFRPITLIAFGRMAFLMNRRFQVSAIIQNFINPS